MAMVLCVDDEPSACAIAELPVAFLSHLSDGSGSHLDPRGQRATGGTLAMIGGNRAPAAKVPDARGRSLGNERKQAQS
jgi:hypothetical protein